MRAHQPQSGAPQAFVQATAEKLGDRRKRHCRIGDLKQANHYGPLVGAGKGSVLFIRIPRMCNGLHGQSPFARL